ncbi:hypothetical protein HDE_03642 [Halotydeus destructor]|nr:hypothetical protein HDE_03642 [Halotydeus destructor]
MLKVGYVVLAVLLHVSSLDSAKVDSWKAQTRLTEDDIEGMKKVVADAIDQCQGPAQDLVSGEISAYTFLYDLNGCSLKADSELREAIANVTGFIQLQGDLSFFTEAQVPKVRNEIYHVARPFRGNMHVLERSFRKEVEGFAGKGLDLQQAEQLVVDAFSKFKIALIAEVDKGYRAVISHLSAFFD